MKRGLRLKLHHCGVSSSRSSSRLTKSYKVLKLNKPNQYYYDSKFKRYYSSGSSLSNLLSSSSSKIVEKEIPLMIQMKVQNPNGGRGPEVEVNLKYIIMEQSLFAGRDAQETIQSALTESFKEYSTKTVDSDLEEVIIETVNNILPETTGIMITELYFNRQAPPDSDPSTPTSSYSSSSSSSSSTTTPSNDNIITKGGFVNPPMHPKELEQREEINNKIILNERKAQIEAAELEAKSVISISEMMTDSTIKSIRKFHEAFPDLPLTDATQLFWKQQELYLSRTNSNS